MRNKIYAALATVGVLWLGLMLAIMRAAQQTARVSPRRDPVEVQHGHGAPR